LTTHCGLETRALTSVLGELDGAAATANESLDEADKTLRSLPA
jgi:hypothetical protein